MNAKDIKAHLALLGAASMWGLMSPVGKAAMEAGVSGLSLANMRMIGADAIRDASLSGFRLRRRSTLPL